MKKRRKTIAGPAPIYLYTWIRFRPAKAAQAAGRRALAYMTVGHRPQHIIDEPPGGGKRSREAMDVASLGFSGNRPKHIIDAKRPKHIIDARRPRHIIDVYITTRLRAMSLLLPSTLRPQNVGAFDIHELPPGTNPKQAAAWIRKAEGKRFAGGGVCILLQTELRLT